MKIEAFVVDCNRFEGKTFILEGEVPHKGDYLELICGTFKVREVKRKYFHRDFGYYMLDNIEIALEFISDNISDNNESEK